MACTQDTTTIALSTAAGVLSATVKVSATAGNRASANADGIFVGGDFIETGDIVTSARTGKVGFLLCDGSAVSRSTYAALFAVCGATYGAGDGSTTFNLPDLRDRVVIGAGANTGLGGNDGVAAVNRHQTRHRHNPHAHVAAHGQFITLDSNQGGNITAATPTAGGNDDRGQGTNAVDGGSGISTDPLDGPAFMGLNIFIKT